MNPISGFKSLETHHCITGSILHIYTYNNYEISEDMLLGLGSGMGFIYWHVKGTQPFIGGRANIERPGFDGLEKTLGQRTGVNVESFRTSSARKAEKTLLELLDANEPVMLQVDMGYLPYLDLPEDFHFGYHVIVAAGYNPVSRQVLIADRDKDLHVISVDELDHTAVRSSNLFRLSMPGGPMILALPILRNLRISFWRSGRFQLAW